MRVEVAVAGGVNVFVGVLVLVGVLVIVGVKVIVGVGVLLGVLLGKEVGSAGKAAPMVLVMRNPYCAKSI